MGKRKVKRTKLRRRKIKPLDTRFSCPVCNNEQVVVCKMVRNSSIGHATCQLCGASYSCKINKLSHPIDIYSSWIDEVNR